jgi:hypothetical protein
MKYSGARLHDRYTDVNRAAGPLAVRGSTRQRKRGDVLWWALGGAPIRGSAGAMRLRKHPPLYLTLRLMRRAKSKNTYAALCPPADLARACSHAASCHIVESTQARADPTAWRLPVKAPLTAPRPRSAPLRSVAPALTGPCRRCGLVGHEPGGARRASQEAHPADPCSGGHAG